jgi:hypothetical protein
MTSNEYLKDEHGEFACDMCWFRTVHENRIQRHMVKSHGHEAYPEPPVLATKWQEWQAQEEEGGRTPAPTKGSKKAKEVKK